MATTFATVAFKNKTIDLLTGVSATSTPIAGIIPFYQAVQPADPSTAISGSPSFLVTNYASAPQCSSNMSTASGGVAMLTANRSPVTPANALTVASMNFARIFSSAGTPLIDCSVSAAGGGGSVIIDNINSSAGVGNMLQGFSLKLPATNGGTLRLNGLLVNRMVDLWTGVQTTAVPYMGINTSGTVALMCYSGSAPSSADDAATGTLLAQINISTQIWGAAAGGAAALIQTPTAFAVGTGTIGYARLVKTYGAITFVIQGAVSTTTNTSDFVLNTLSTTSGVTAVTLTEATISI